MKKNLILGLLTAAAVLPFVSCSNDDDDNKAKDYQLALSFTLPDTIEASHVSDVKVVLSNQSGNDTLELSALKDTTITRRQGIYSVSVSGKLSDEATAFVTGQSNVDLYANSLANVRLDKVNKSSLIFRTIYSTGSKQYYMKESYFEIVNNSDEVQYLDQVILMAPQGNQTKANAWQANGYADLYASGQGSVVAFPGNGHDYPILPGQSVLIANNATNHKLAYGDDESQKDDYALCPDLSHADWEIYLDYNANDVDYPDVPNMDVIFQNNKYMFAFGLGVMGRSYLLAKLPEGITPAEYAADPANLMVEPGTQGTMQYLMIPSKYVLDAVDTYNPNTDNHYLTFLPKDDRSGVKCSVNYTGKCLRRKVIAIKNGHAVYKDTNDSQADFLNEQPLLPGVQDTQVDE